MAVNLSVDNVSNNPTGDVFISSSLTMMIICLSGHCIALVQGDDRTLAANIGAAAKYRQEDLVTESAKTILFSVKILYVEGFFLSHSPGVVRALCDICQENSVSLAFNLCGEYVCKNQGAFTNQ